MSGFLLFDFFEQRRGSGVGGTVNKLGFSGVVLEGVSAAGLWDACQTHEF